MKNNTLKPLDLCQSSSLQELLQHLLYRTFEFYEYEPDCPYSAHWLLQERKHPFLQRFPSQELALPFAQTSVKAHEIAAHLSDEVIHELGLPDHNCETFEPQIVNTLNTWRGEHPQLSA